MPNNLVVRFHTVFPDGSFIPPYPPNGEEVSAIRLELLNAARVAWARLDSPDWRRLHAIGTIHRPTKYGLSFEASRTPVVDGALPAMELFHICKAKPCGFKGGGRSVNSKGLPVHHVANFAFSDEATLPAANVPQAVVRAVAESPKYSWKVVLGTTVLAVGLISRFQLMIKEVNVHQTVSWGVKKTTTFFVDNVFILAYSTETGIVEGFSESLGENYAWWFPWVIRLLAYGYPTFRYRMAHRVWALIQQCWRPTASRKPVPASGPAPATPSPSTPASDATSDTDGGVCQAGTVHMMINDQIRPLSTGPCGDSGDDNVVLAVEDGDLPHLPDVDKVSGAPLCQMHRDAYHTLRGHTI